MFEIREQISNIIGHFKPSTEVCMTVLDIYPGLRRNVSSFVKWSPVWSYDVESVVVPRVGYVCFNMGSTQNLTMSL